MIQRPCLSCGRLTRNGSRCPTCQRARERARPARPTNATRDPAERRRRAEAVAQWKALYGSICPGWNGYDPHPVAPPNVLTADHVVAVARGGADGPLVVLCRRCNSAKGAR